MTSDIVQTNAGGGKDAVRLWARGLTYAGLIPFVAGVFAAALTEGPFFFVVQAYAAVIISFLCGIHWAAYLFFSDRCPSNFLIRSNVVALLAWVSLIMPFPRLSMVLQILCFLYLLRLDYQLVAQNLIQEWYYKIRVQATCVVVLMLIILCFL